MKTTKRNWNRKAGYISYMVVLTLGLVLLVMMVHTYDTAVNAQQVQGETTLRSDYTDKEDAVLRAIVPITANRAMRCMQDGSDASSRNRTPLRWQKIFRSAIEEGNAESSIKGSVLSGLELSEVIVANPGDAATWSSQTFFPLDGDRRNYVTPGLNVDLGRGFPVPLQTDSTRVEDLDPNWPIISTDKYYADLAEERVGAGVDTFPQYNLLPYPKIRFGYTKPGEPFVAKRNWWAFRMTLSDHMEYRTKLPKRQRDFVISIYEVPSQLAISAEAFTVLGEYADGTRWQNTRIEGGVFASRSKVASGMNLDWLSARHGIDLALDAQVGANPLIDANDISSIGNMAGGEPTLAVDPFAPGARERYEHEHGSYMPVSMASEAGRSAFIPINRGSDFFDRHSHAPETETISTTTWNEYTVGALQCAMRLDISDVPDVDDPVPSELTFSYMANGVREEMVIPLNEGTENQLEVGFIEVAQEHETVLFEETVDVAYGKNGEYYYEYGVTGDVTFNNDRFGDPI